MEALDLRAPDTCTWSRDGGLCAQRPPSLPRDSCFVSTTGLHPRGDQRSQQLPFLSVYHEQASRSCNPQSSPRSRYCSLPPSSQRRDWGKAERVCLHSRYVAGPGFKPTEFTGSHDAVLPPLGHQRLLAVLLWTPPCSVLSSPQSRHIRRPETQPDPRWPLGSACH